MVDLSIRLSELEQKKFRNPSGSGVPAVAVVNPDGSSIGVSSGSATVAIGSSATLYAITNASSGNVTLNPSTNFIGLITAVIGSAPTLFAVVNTGVAGQASVVLDAGNKFIGLVTAVIGSSPTIYAITNASSGNVTLNPSPNFIGLVTAVQGALPYQVIGNATGGLADSGNPVKVGGIYFSVATIYTDSNRVPLQMDVNGNTKVTLATLLAGEDLTNNLIQIAGNVAHGSADVGSPVKIGGIATPQTAFVSTASGNRVNAWFDNQGRLATFFQAGSTVAIGSSPTLYALVNTAALTTGNVTLNPSPNYIGLVTAVIGSAPTIFAVVNTSAAGQASIVLDAGTKFIGLVTAVIGSAPTLYAVVNTGASNSNVTLNPSPNYIGLVSVSGNVIVSQASAANLNSVVFGYDGSTQRAISTDTSGRPILGAGANYIGLASVNIGGTLPALTTGTAYIGLASVNVGGVLPALSAGTNFIGLATVIPSYGSNVTIYTFINSASGFATLFTPPSGQRFFLKNLHVSSLGRSDVEFRSGATQLIPFTSLSTTAGFFEHYGELGLPGRLADDAFVVSLQTHGATITGMANVRFGL